jgi:hypothetical protein
MTTNEEHTPRILSDETQTRYIELSTQCEEDVYWHPSVTITLAAFSESGVMLHRMKSEETAIRFDLSTQEIEALISGYTAYRVTHECRTPQRRSAEWFDELADPLAILDDHPV